MERIKKVCLDLKACAFQAFFITDASNIRYLTGYQGDDAFLLLQDEGSAFLITDGRYLEQAQKDCGKDGICVIEHSPAKNPLSKVVAGLLKRFDISSLAFEKEHISFALFDTLANELGPVKLVPASDLIAKFRLVKDPDELAKLKTATAIADRAFTETLKSIRPGVSEKQLEAKLVYNLLYYGAEKISFPSIIASGPNGSLPHALPSERKLQKGDLVTFDFGAVYQGYHSDTTRTVVLGKPTAKQKEIYELVGKTQADTAAILKPGLSGQDAHMHAAAIIREGGYEGYFNHGLGHGTGLDIHERPTLNPRSKDILTAGNTVTCEPGVYLPGWGGVRIEDTLIITSCGAEALGTISKELLIL